MKIRSLFLVFIFGALAAAAMAQGRTVTNADLDRYKAERVRGETDLRENYARLGFPSPEEMERREAVALKERNELVARLTRERIEQERIDAQIRAASAAYYASQPRTIVVQGANDAGILSYGYGYNYGYGDWPVIRPRRMGYEQPGYFAGGQFWPTGPRTPPQPLIRIGPRR